MEYIPEYIRKSFSSESPKKILFIIPEATTYEFSINLKEEDKFDPAKERKYIEEHLKENKLIQLEFAQKPLTSKGIADQFIHMCPQVIIFYTHGLANDLHLQEQVRLSSDLLKDIIEYTKRNTNNFNPFFIIGACYSVDMAKEIHDKLKHPAIGFTGQIYPSSLSPFLIKLINSYANNVHLSSAFDSGLSSAEELHIQARLFVSDPTGWIKTVKDLFVDSEVHKLATWEKYGFFHRISSLTSSSCLVTNHTTIPVYVTVKTPDDPIQMLFVNARGSQKVFIGYSASAHFSVFSRCGDVGFYVHGMLDRKIPANSTFNIKDTHITSNVAKFMPGFESFNAQYMRKLDDQGI